jgi:hypothetical protein
MDLTAIRAGIAEELRAVAGLRVYAEWPDKPEVPCACMVIDGITPDQTFGPEYGTLVDLRIDVLTSPMPDGARSQVRLDAMLSEQIPDALRAASLAAKAARDADDGTFGDAHDVHWTSTSGLREMNVGGVAYMGHEVSVSVWARHS